MKKSILKVLSVIMALTLIFGVMQISVFAATSVDYKITNPYSEVADLLAGDANHYKTNLHTHSTYSDADIDLRSMVTGHYNQDFDILGMADHGVIGVEWDRNPTLVPLYQYNHALLNDQSHLTTEEYKAILDGSYRTDLTTRVNKNGMQCVTGGIEGNMLVAQKNHINGYFIPEGSEIEGFLGNEGDYDTAAQMIEDVGGLSHINHPGDWLDSGKREVLKDEDGNPILDENGNEQIVRTEEGIAIATDPENVQFFANTLRKYPSCLGIEVYNSYDRPTCNDRILWDELLKVVIPEGRNVWGFANNDAHNYEDIDTSFMDFVLPEYNADDYKDLPEDKQISEEQFNKMALRTAMTKGHFFAVSRYDAGVKIGEGKKYPQVTSIIVDDTEGKDTITIIAKNTETINWIADGAVIESTSIGKTGVVISKITLQDYSDDISCYVRAELEGEGGKTLTQAFVCDDGNMEDLINRGPAATAPVDIITLIRSMIKMFIRMFMGIFE